MGKPNIILIQSNSHPWDCAGYAGSKDVHTPNLDALAAHGVLFEQAVHPGGATSSAQSVLLMRDPRHEQLCVPGVLKACGYETGFAGNLYFPASDFGDAFDGAQPRDENTGDSIARTGNLAVRFVQNAQEPFFLYVCFDEPGPPSVASDAPLISDFHTSISLLDKQVGRILATLSARAITNNVVIYCAANGAGDEPENRVPLIIAGLPEIRRGRDNTPATLADVPPFIMRTAGVTI
jgi:arylsulfatase A-like enzyme